MQINNKKLVLRIILFIIILAPLYGYQEVLGLIEGDQKVYGKAITPLWIKAIKDVGLVLSIALSFLIQINLNLKIEIFKFYSYFSLLFLFLLFWISFASSPYIAIAGVRWLLPFVLGIVLIHVSERSWLSSIGKVMVLLFVFQFGYQVVELNVMQCCFGKQTLLGREFVARVPGFFPFPSTGAFFVVVTVFLGYFYVLKFRWQKQLLIVFGWISIYLTQSGTGMIVLIVFISFVIFRKSLILVSLLSPVVLFVSLLFIENLVKRSNYLKMSGGTRLEMFLNQLQQGEFISSSFGSATNAGHLFNIMYKLDLNTMIADSNHFQILKNLGLIPFFIFLIFLILWLVASIKINRVDIMCFIFIYFLYGFTTNILEAFPMSLVFGVCFSIYVKEIWVVYSYKRSREIIN
jgi:hypothetical protein